MSIHPSAIVDPDTHIADSAEIGPLVVIGKGVSIGERTILCEVLIGKSNSESYLSSDWVEMRRRPRVEPPPWVLDRLFEFRPVLDPNTCQH